MRSERCTRTSQSCSDTDQRTAVCCCKHRKSGQSFPQHVGVNELQVTACMHTLCSWHGGLVSSQNSQAALGDRKPAIGKESEKSACSSYARELTSLRLPHCWEPPARRGVARATGSRLRAGDPPPRGANEPTYGAQRQCIPLFDGMLFVRALVAIMLSSPAPRRHAYMSKGAGC